VEGLKLLRVIIFVNEDEKIFHVDVTSLYPTVNALDPYAVGFKKYVKITADDILKDRFLALHV
jgi:hypothetical protein